MTREECYDQAIECLKAFKASDYAEHPVTVSVEPWKNDRWLVTTPKVEGVWDTACLTKQLRP